MKKTKEVIEVKIDEFIPYQLCPMCKGHKSIWLELDWRNQTTNISPHYENCGICFGAGIIPMHKIETQMSSGPRITKTG